MLPVLGYRGGYELTDAAERRSERLPARPDRSGEDDERESEWVTFDFTVSTDGDQIPVTSGQLQRTWTDGGRRYARYVSERAVPNGVGFASARYRVARDAHRCVAIEIYSQPRQAFNVERIMRAAKDSLDAFSNAYGPYPYHQLKLVEVPAPGNTFGGLARPDTILLNERRSFLIDARDPDRLDLVYRRTAHEVAHQWWGMELAPADEPGASMVSESVTKYSELMVLERAYGRDVTRRSLAIELDLYLSGRAAESGAELPLSQSRYESYLYYRKGSIVMYALKDLLGEQALNSALRAFVHEQSGPGRHPTARLLIDKLRAAATPEQWTLADQWLNQVVLYDLRVESASAKKTAGGFEVSLRINANKRRATGELLPFDEQIDIGALDRAGKVIAVEKRRLHAGANDVMLTVAGQAAVAAVDPYVLRIDRDRSDNEKPLW